MAARKYSQDQKRLDPFYEEPVQKAFYYPSPPRHVTRRDKEISIQSPRRHEASKKISPAEKEFLRETHSYKRRFPVAEDEKDDSSKFDESWPASERPSTLGTPQENTIPSPIHGLVGNSLETSELFSKELSRFLQDPTKTHLEFDDQPVRDSYEFQKLRHIEDQTHTTPRRADSDSQGSTLSRYIERFRNGPALSRNERENVKPTQDFWWLATSPPTPSDSSTPKDDKNTVKTKARTPRVASLEREPAMEKTRKGTSNSSSISSGIPKLRQKNLEEHDRLTSDLQDRASRLIQRSEGSLNSSDPVVSTDGMSTSTGSHRTYEEEPYRPGFLRSSAGKEGMPIMTKPKRPEDDVLVQWRMRRKMELARERVGGPPSDNKYKSKVKAEDIESKLAEFRKRLDEGLDGTLTGQRAELKQLPTKIESVTADKTPAKEDHVHADAGVQTSLPSTPSRSTTPPPSTQENACIASPSIIKSKSKQSTNDVGPHYHLACDIIPCQHEQHSKSRLTEDSDSSFERMKIKHLNQLHGERELEDDSYWNDLPEHDKREGITRPRLSGMKLRDTGVNRGNPKKQNPAEKQKGNASDRSKDSKSRDVQRSHSPQRPPPKRKTTRPPSTSSPLHPPLQSTVGQVVRDRLFTSSMEVVSSIDTTIRESPETRIKRPLQEDHVPEEIEPADELSDENLEEILDISDSEEFADDIILRDLRQKRIKYVEELQEIEKKLADLES